MDASNPLHGISWSNGYYDATDGKLFNDFCESDKEQYAQGFAAGKEERGQEDYISFRTFRDLVGLTKEDANDSNPFSRR